MASRAYVLLKVAGNDPDKVVRVLSNKPGVVSADVLEGPPGVLMTIEARGRQQLAERCNRALAAVENMIADSTLLPVRDEVTPAKNTAKDPPTSLAAHVLLKERSGLCRSR